MTKSRTTTLADVAWHGFTRAAAVALSLTLSGCGEPDPPPSGGATAATDTTGSDTGGTIDVAAEIDRTDDAPGDVPAVVAELAPVPAAPVAAPDDLPLVEPAPSSPSSPDATIADCAIALPCRLESGDGSLVTTLTAADGDALDGGGPLRVDVVLEARSRDATIAIEPTSSVVSSGQVLTVDASRLGLPSAPGARDEASFPLVAGVPINGHVTFGGTLLGNPALLDRVTLHLSEAGTTFAATFTGVPLGPEPGAPIDCADTLPCLWTSSDGGATLALTDAAPARWNRATRLTVSWSLAATRPLEIALVGPGRVTNASGETLEPYGIELGGIESRDGTVLTQALAAGDSVTGLTVPRRAPEEGDRTLARVEIAVVERRSPRTPRWKPVFLNVPLRAAEPDG